MSDLAVAVYVIFVILAYPIIRLLHSKRVEYDKHAMLYETESWNKKLDPALTTGVLEFIRYMITQKSIIKVRALFDSKDDPEKTTLPQIKTVVKEIAEDVHDALDEKFYEEILIVDEEFLNQYIIDLAMILVKDLLDKTVEEIAEIAWRGDIV